MSDEIIYTKVNYFIDYWRDFTYNNSIEEELTHTIVYNPRELFKEFADEISRTELKNKENKDFFINYIKKFSCLEIQSIDYLQTTLTLIKQQFQNPNFQYLLHLLVIMDGLLSNNRLGFNCVDELEKVLTNNIGLNNDSKDQIKTLTNLIIFELIYKKYSTQTLEKVIDNIFDRYSIDEGILWTNFPHNFAQEDIYKLTDSEFQQYQQKIIDLIDNLTLSQRLLSIKNYFDKQPKKLTYIFQIKGLKGNIDITFGNVRIYNPEKVTLIKNRPSDNIELFNSKKFIYCNGAVTLDVIDEEYAKQEAFTLLSKTIDIIVSNYSGYKVPIEINNYTILTCDQDGNKRGESSKNNSESIKHHDSVALSQSDNIEYLFNFYNKLNDRYFFIDKKILESLHWKRKAIESLNTNEKILWYWISIENIIGDTSTIFNIVSKFLAVNQLYAFAWKHFEKINRIIRLGSFGYFRKNLVIPEELKQSIGLNQQTGKIYLNNFVEKIPDIQNLLDKNELLFAQLDYLKDIFDESSKILKLLTNFEEISREKLIFIYRIRNKIVHEASNQTTCSTNYYLKFISEVTSIILFEFIKKRNDKNLETVEQIINDIMYDFDSLKIDIKEHGSIILLNNS